MFPSRALAHVVAAVVACLLLVSAPFADDNVGRWNDAEVFGSDESVGRFPVRVEAPVAVDVAPPVASHVEPPTLPPVPEIATVAPPAATDQAPWQQPPINASFPGESSVLHAPHDTPLVASRPWFDIDNWFRHGHPDSPGKHIGYGEPLKGTSWLNRPHSASVMFGLMMPDDLRGANANPQDDYWSALQVGYDFDHYWGCEFRFGAGSFDLRGSPTGSSNEMVQLDAHLNYYPWGDARWRPYWSIGLGAGNHGFTDFVGQSFDNWVVTVPLGVGVKYQYTRNCVLRGDVTHYLSPDMNDLNAMDNAAVTLGVEWRFGGSRKSYYPWNPSYVLD